MRYIDIFIGRLTACSLAVIPFLLGSAVLLILLQTSQGLELVQISSAGSKSLVDGFLIGCVPLQYAVLTAIFAAPALKVQGGSAISQRADHVISLVVIILVTSPVSALLFWHFPWTEAFGVHFGLTLITLTAIADPSGERFGCFIRSASAFLLLGFVGALVFLPNFPERIGTVGTVVIALAFWASAFTLVWIRLPAIFSRVSPLLAVVYLLTATAFSYYLLRAAVEADANNVAGISGQEPPAAKWMVEDYFYEWLEKRASALPAESSIPVFLVAAEGGGLRATAWTMETLDQLDKSTEGKFSSLTFALSGVSGGAVGIGYYVECRFRAEPNAKCGSDGVRHDFLAPAIARLLLVEPVRAVPTFRQRLESRDKMFERNLEKVSGNPTAERRLSAPMLEVLRADRTTLVPIVILNTTDAASGRRVYFSNKLMDVPFASNALAYGDGIKSVPLSYAMHSSARFPLVSPPTSLGPWDLVDGGYRENIGLPEIKVVMAAILNAIAFGEKRIQDLDPIEYDNLPGTDYEKEESKKQARTLLRRFKKAKKILPLLRRVQVYVVAITNECYVDCSKSTSSTLPEIRWPPANATREKDISAPIQALLSSRDSRTRESIQELHASLQAPVPEDEVKCQVERRAAYDRYGKVGTLGYLVAPQLHHEREPIPCEERKPRHLLMQFSLHDAMPDNYPALGWVLSKQGHDAIAYAAKGNDVGEAFEMTPWYVQLRQNWCGGVGSGDAIFHLRFDENAKPVCREIPITRN